MKSQLLRRLLLPVVGLLYVSTLQAETLTLRQAYLLAEDNDPQWAAAKNTYSANQQVVDLNRSGVLPQIGLQGSYSESNVDYEDLGDDSFDSHSYSASVRQPLFDLESWHTYQLGKALDNQYSAEFQNTREDFLLRVLTLYLDVLRADANVTFRQAEQEAIDRQLEQSKQRFEVGLVAITDVHEAQAAYDTAVSARIAAESDLFVALRQLETVTGVQVDDVVNLSPELPILPPEPADLDTWIKGALERNASLQAANFAVNAAEQNYKSQRGRHAPTLDLVGTHSYTSTGAPTSIGTEQPDTTRDVISLELAMPLYSGGGISASRRQSHYQFLATQDQQRLARRATIQDTTSFYQLTVANVAQVKARNQSTVSARVALEATQAGYEAGTRTIVDVLNVQRNLFQNERDYTNARFDYVLNSLRLKRAAGVLTAEELLTLNQWMAKQP
ncbi:MAG: TolC family outer membrane protein [Pseudomonadota bacterium]|nr:secretion protein [Pseudomonadales bacterium]MDY6919198.1 TolC family outer membrane protein [Pseudomonadota bacterium]